MTDEILEEIEENLLRQTTLEAVVDFHDRSLPAVLEAIRLDTPTYYAYRDKIVASIKRAADKWGLTDTVSERQKIHYLANDAAKDFLDRWTGITVDD